MLDLYPDQQELIGKVSQEMRSGSRAVLLQASTGSGKSVMASYMVKKSMEKGKRVWFSVPRKDLIRQMHKTFEQFDLQHSYIAAGHSLNPFAQSHICSTATLRRRLKLDRLKAPHLAVIDETHFGEGDLDEIITWLKQPHYEDDGTVYYTYIIGLSATPWKLSGRGLGCWYDKMVCGPSIRWLIDNKRLSEYRAFAPSIPDLSQINISNGEYAKGQLSDRMEQDRLLIGSAVSHYKKHSLGKLGVTFAVSRKHSEMLAQEYRDQGIIAVHMDGDMSDHERIRIAKAFANREIQQLCNCDLLKFGYDLASASGVKNVCIESMNDCAPSMSLSNQKQKNGRNLRYDGTVHDFYDHAGNIQRHGLPCDEVKWSLEDRVKSKRESGEKTMSLKQCDRCYFVHKPAPICPNCKNVYEVMSRDIEEIDGELVEIDIKAAERVRIDTMKQKLDAATTLDDLRAIRKENKYHTNWVSRQAKLRGIKV